MFYLVRNLKTQLSFTPYQMDKLAKDDQIIKRLKQKVQGRCLTQYGYIIQVVKGQGEGSQSGNYKISQPTIYEQGSKVAVTFSAITFKPQKNDILDIFVTQIQQDIIKGTLGHAEVFIPKRNMGNEWHYKKNQNIFVTMGQQAKIEKGTKLRCKCFQVITTDMNSRMRIIADLEKQYLGPLA